MAGGSRVALALLASLGALPGSAWGAPDAKSGLHGGARLELGLPHGLVEEHGDDVSRYVDYWVGAELHLGWRFSPRWVLTAYASYGAGRTASRCSTIGDCASDPLRYGLLATLELTPDWDPVGLWVGAGAGFTQLHYAETVPAAAPPNTQRDHRTYWGVEVVSLQAGADVRATPQLRVGPFAALTYGQFLTEAQVVADWHPWQEIRRPTYQGWFLFGVRFTLDSVPSDPAALRRAAVAPPPPPPGPEAMLESALDALRGIDRLEAMGREELVRSRLREVVLQLDVALAQTRPEARYPLQGGDVSGVELQRRLEEVRASCLSRIGQLDRALERGDH